MDPSIDGTINVVNNGDLHPLTIPEVVEHVMQYCTFEELKTCRQVSKQWLDSSLKFFRKSARVNLIAGKRGSNMSDFIKFVNNRKNKISERPYTEYALTGTIGITMPLWDTCDPITVLNFESCSFRSLEQFRTLIYTTCPNLKKLSLVNCNVEGRSIHLSGVHLYPLIAEPVLWEEPQFGENLQLTSLKTQRHHFLLGVSMMEVLSHFPSLTNLELEGPGRDLDDDRLFQAVERIRRHDPNKLKLTSIKTWCDKHTGGSMVSDALVRVVVDPLINLEELSIGVNGDNAIHRLRNIIWHNDSSLRKLELFRTPAQSLIDPEDIFPLPYGRLMENLEEITLGCVFKTLLFLQSTPNLKILKIHPCSMHCMGANALAMTSLEEMEDVVMTNCVKLDLRGVTLSEQDLRKLVVWFPNLEEVAIRLDNRLFGIVCEGWPKLKKLEVTKSVVFDSGITGLDLEDIVRINGRRRNRSWRPVTVPRANITSLKNLQDLSLTSGDPSTLCLSFGYAGVSGILEVPNLTTLTIQNYHISKELKRILSSKIKNCSFV